MNAGRRLLLAGLALCVAEARGQTTQREPHIGYLYPAGGRQGTTVRVLVGGQNLNSADAVHVTGDGIHASVVKHYRPLRNLSDEQREELRARMAELIRKRWDELVAAGSVQGDLPWREFLRRRPAKAEAAKTEPVKLPDHPLLENLEKKSLRELLHVKDELAEIRKRQQNQQIAEMVLIEARIDAQAQPGDRELRLGTRQGLTNPMIFQVGTLPETREIESNNPGAYDFLPPEPALKLPVLINGQVMPGDVDRFRFKARTGQRLVIHARARHLIPYLADAVPGWFQATLALYDSAGREIAFDDDYRFDPDPVLSFVIPEDGEYELEIRDSIYRGREDFVYRVSVGELPFITSMFPLGSRAGQGRYVSIDGWNLTSNRLFLDAQPDQGKVRRKTWGRGKRSSNPLYYDVDALRAEREIENNDTPADAQRVKPHLIIDGRIDPPGDVDMFRFNGKTGDVIVVEVMARRLGSPLDSLVRFFDAGGEVLAWNDDYEYKDGFLHTDMGLLTHHADSYLSVELPRDGSYHVQIADAQNQGGPAYGYRLRISPPRPDFALRMTPSSVNIPAGRAAPITVYALRKDGFAGEIEVDLRDAPAGFKLDGARIPAGRDRVRMTLTAPNRRIDEPVRLELEGYAKIDGKLTARAVVPSEDMMQAFLYRHLIPSQELLAAVTPGGRLAPALALEATAPLRIAPGGVIQVRLKSSSKARIPKLELELNEPPKGIVLENVAVVSGGVTFELRADPDVEPTGPGDNLIIEVFTEIEREARDRDGPPRKVRMSLGVLPAIPYEIASK